MYHLIVYTTDRDREPCPICQQSIERGESVIDVDVMLPPNDPRPSVCEAVTVHSLCGRLVFSLSRYTGISYRPN